VHACAISAASSCRIHARLFGVCSTLVQHAMLIGGAHEIYTIKSCLVYCAHARVYGCALTRPVSVLAFGHTHVVLNDLSLAVCMGHVYIFRMRLARLHTIRPRTRARACVHPQCACVRERVQHHACAGYGRSCVTAVKLCVPRVVCEFIAPCAVCVCAAGPVLWLMCARPT
jgi:hypothetical protein